MTSSYIIRRTDNDGKNGWNESDWKHQPALNISYVLPQTTTANPPSTKAKLLYNNQGLFVYITVANEQGVLRRFTSYQDPVYKDSCVELFIQPKEGYGYFNFEMNGLGTLLLSYIEIDGKGNKNTVNVPHDLGSLVQILDKHISPNPDQTVNWHVKYFIPFKLFKQYVDINTTIGWKGNLYKCCDDHTTPHWISWAPITNNLLNFHQPLFFGTLVFEDALDRLPFC